MMNRRHFGAIMVAAGLLGNDVGAEALQPEVLQLHRNGWVPNNHSLPVLLYRGVFRKDIHDVAGVVEATFLRNGWPPQWRNGVYDFHHYHSTAHEALGFAAGEGRLVLGGDGGTEVHVRAGDLVILPVGTGHCKVEASKDFLVVGAYLPGERWDICRSAPDAGIVSQMKVAKFPLTDPVFGPNGPLQQHWKVSS